MGRWDTNRRPEADNRNHRLTGHSLYKISHRYKHRATGKTFCPALQERVRKSTGHFLSPLVLFLLVPTLLPLPKASMRALAVSPYYPL